MSMRMLKRSIPRLWGESSASSSNAQFPGSNSGLAQCSGMTLSG